MPRKKLKIGLVDADLLCNGTRHPNLVLMKLAGFLNDNGIDFKLIIDQDEDITPYKLIYISRVFTFTQMPVFYENATPAQQKKFRRGGTGFYANELNVNIYRQKRDECPTIIFTIHLLTARWPKGLSVINTKITSSIALASLLVVASAIAHSASTNWKTKSSRIPTLNGFSMKNVMSKADWCALISICGTTTS